MTTRTNPTPEATPRRRPELGPFLSVRQAVEYTGLSRATLYRMMEDRTLAFHEVVTRKATRRRIRVADLDRLLRRRAS